MGTLNFQELISAFIVLFAVIDIIGAVPIILDLKQKGRAVNAVQATLIAAALLLGFFFAGDMMLKLFQVDIASFAVAGAFVIFLMSLEMILDIEIFKNTGPIKEATLVPLVFPLLAGAGSFTTLLSLRAEYASINIIIALLLNMVWVYIVLKMTDRRERWYLYYPEILRYNFACYFRSPVYCKYNFFDRSVPTVKIIKSGQAMQEKNCSLFPIYPDVERLYFRISPLPIHKWASLS